MNLIVVVLLQYTLLTNIFPKVFMLLHLLYIKIVWLINSAKQFSTNIHKIHKYFTVFTKKLCEKVLFFIF